MDPMVKEMRSFHRAGAARFDFQHSRRTVEQRDRKRHALPADNARVGRFPEVPGHASPYCRYFTRDTAEIRS